MDARYSSLIPTLIIRVNCKSWLNPNSDTSNFPVTGLTVGILFVTLAFFGAVGVQYFAGVFKSACVVENLGMMSNPRRFCTANSTCPAGMYCVLDLGNPVDRLYSNFDNTGHAINLLFQVMTMLALTLFLSPALNMP